MSTLPARARVVVIGGGVIGCGVLYYLAKAGCGDAVLLEHHELTSGTTWGSSALVTHFASSPFITRLHKEALELWRSIEAEAGQPTGLHLSGSLRLAASGERMKEYRRYQARAAYLGVAIDLVGPERIRELHPFIDVAGLVGAAHTPDDGYVDPASATQALAKAATRRGAKVVRGCGVNGLARLANGDWRLTTNLGDMTAEIVVNAAGMWAPVLGEMVGRYLPVVAMERQYYVTEPAAELKTLPREVPVLRDPDGTFYMRQETDAFLVGPYERRPRFWDVAGLPPHGGQQALPPYLDEASEPIDDAIARVPILARLGIRANVNVPTSRSPDGNPLVGPLEGLPNHFVAAGFFGGLSEVSVCRHLVEWILEGEPGADIWPFDSRRYGAWATKAYAIARTRERHVVGLTQEISYPAEEPCSGRPARTSPLYHRLLDDRAVFGARAGWECANWFAHEGEERADRLSFERPNWFAAVGRECRLVQAAVAVLDYSALAKFEIAGPAALRFLERLCASDLPAAPGASAAALMLSPRGRVMALGTLTRLAEDRFLMTAVPEAERHHLDWLRLHAPSDGGVAIDDVTARHGALLLAGPKSGDVLAALANLDPASLSLAREITIGSAPVRAIPNSLTGESGWELHCPSEYLAGLYEAVVAAGAAHGIGDFGYRALDLLRLEAGRLQWARDVGLDGFAADAGLGALVSARQAFIGRERAQDESGRRLCHLAVDAGAADAWGSEPVYVDGRAVALVRAGGYGHRRQQSLAVAYLPTALAKPGGRVEIDILGERRPGRILEAPLYS